VLAIRSKRALTRRAPSTKYEEISYNLVVGESHSFLPPAGLLSLSFETLSLSLTIIGLASQPLLSALQL
jgi:hypothetical protein